MSKPHCLDLLVLLTACWLLVSLQLTLGQIAYPRVGVSLTFGVSDSASVARSPVPIDGRLEASLLAGTP